jgi:alkaline phosphatase D
LIVEYSTAGSFAEMNRVAGPAALETSDFTARVDLSGLRPGQRIFYRARFQSLQDLRISSEPIAGTFTTPPAIGSPRDVTIAWTADTAGQGWGIDADMGGMRLYDTMRKVDADVFIHTGDTIYADGPLQPEVKLDDGRVWRNLVTPEKSKVAETLDEFRGNHRYNLLDEHVRRFNASVSQFVIWDDHEVLNNWYPTEILGKDVPHAEKSVALLAARARRAFQEYTPNRFDPSDPERIYRACRFGPLVEIFGFDMRSYRGPNSANRQTTASDESALLGASQVDWLKRRLAASTATWKIIASGMPLGLVVTDGPLFEPGRWSAARTRSGDRRAADVHPRSAHPQRRLHHRRRALLRGAPLRSGAGRVHCVPSFLGVRGRAGACRHVRPERAGSNVRTRGEIPRHPARHEREPAAERRSAVLRYAAGPRRNPRADGDAAQRRR